MRMGMEMSETNGQLCVELDTGSVFSDYVPYVASFEGVPGTLKYDLKKTLSG